MNAPEGFCSRPNVLAYFCILFLFPVFLFELLLNRKLCRPAGGRALLTGGKCAKQKDRFKIWAGKAVAWGGVLQLILAMKRGACRNRSLRRPADYSDAVCGGMCESRRLEGSGAMVCWQVCHKCNVK